MHWDYAQEQLGVLNPVIYASNITMVQNTYPYNANHTQDTYQYWNNGAYVPSAWTETYLKEQIAAALTNNPSGTLLEINRIDTGSKYFLKGYNFTVAP